MLVLLNQPVSVCVHLNLGPVLEHLPYSGNRAESFRRAKRRHVAPNFPYLRHDLALRKDIGVLQSELL